MAVLKLAEYASWDAAITANSSDSFSAAQAWDAITPGQALINYLFNTINSTAFYKGVGLFEGEIVSLERCGEIETGTISWIEEKPTGTSVIVEIAISEDKGSTWGAWISIANGASLPGFIKGLDVTNYRVRYRIKLSTTDFSVAPSVSQIKLKIVSRKLFRIFSNGQVKAKADIIPSVVEQL